MELSYDKAALQEYMDDIVDAGESLRRAKDESCALYNSCRQQYARLSTELEQECRKAYNRIESAESMQRMANAECEFAMRRLENAKDDSERKLAQDQLRNAQMQQAEAVREISVASAAYAKAQANMEKLNDVWERYQPSINSAVHKVEDGLSAFNTLVGNGNRDLGEYMGIMDKAQAALYDGTTGSQVSSGVTSRASANNSGTYNVNSSFMKTSKGNTLELVTTAGASSIEMSLEGKNHSFPHTKSGAAKAYRTAIKSGDQEMVEHTNYLFSSFDSNKAAMPHNQQYVADVLTELESGLPGTFDREMVIAGSQGRKLNSPATETSSGAARGFWNDTVFVLDDNYVPEKYNEDGLTVAQIKRYLYDAFGINVGEIPYVNGVADFSNMSVANIPTADIVIRATGMSSEEYASLSQRERTEVFQDVFSDVSDGKSKRERNFTFADEICAERQIPIPGLREGYTASDLKKWRSDHKFSWDEQVNGGYNLVPTIIHGNVSHTGLVSISGNAYSYLEYRSEDIKLHPQKYSLDEDNAPISISDIFNKK